MGWQVHSLFNSFASLVWSLLSAGLFPSPLCMCAGLGNCEYVDGLFPLCMPVNPEYLEVLIKPRWLSSSLPELPVKSLSALLFFPHGTITSANLCLLIQFYSASNQVSPFLQWQQALFPGSAITLVELLLENVQDGAAQAVHRLTRSFLNWVSGVSTS